MSEPLRIHAWLTTYAEGVLTALTRSGYHAEAVVYACVWGEWAQGVQNRTNEEWCTELGLTLKQLRRRLSSLVELGLLQVVVGEGRRQLVVVVPADASLPSELLQGGALNGTQGDKKGTQGDKKGMLGALNGTPFRVPTEIVENSLSCCYVSICVGGTVLALTTYAAYAVITTYAAYAVNNNKRIVGSNFNCEASQLPLAAELGGAPAPPTREIKKSTGRKKGEKPKGDGPPAGWVAAGSHVFRKLPLVWAEQDAYYAEVTALHAEWCAVLGKAYAMTVWRYAAWRSALVEAGYTATQLREAMPGVAADEWWVANCSDPHVMFGSNPGKIERFFPQNRSSAPDRFGRTQQSTLETFSF